MEGLSGAVEFPEEGVQEHLVGGFSDEDGVLEFVEVPGAVFAVVERVDEA